jgi:hypothetical protein
MIDLVRAIGVYIVIPAGAFGVLALFTYLVFKDLK